MALIDKDAELRDLAALHRRAQASQDAVRRRLAQLRRDGAQLKDLAAAVGLSESQVSRLAAAGRGEGRAETAMDVVRRAQRGQIDHDALVSLLAGWDYAPQHASQDAADDWEFEDNSFDAVEYAYTALDLLSDQEYEQIVAAAA